MTHVNTAISKITAGLAAACLLASAPAHAATEKIVYAFTGGHDGYFPKAGLTKLGGLLYGTTEWGGASKSGTAFSLTLSGTAKTLHSFGAGTDGANPAASLVNAGGTFYSVLQDGGASHEGTVFSITRTGTEATVYAFADSGDANTPLTLINAGGTLYGTTYAGGAADAGTVFSVTPAGIETIIYSFLGSADGAAPDGLVYANGMLYGTTFSGGAHGVGTVFAMTLEGVKTILYNFQNSTADGNTPVGPLTFWHGKLYGGTGAGGSQNLGTIYSITPAGKEKILHSFAGGADGSIPYSGLLFMDGAFYGTTAGGGQSAGCTGCGTVFSVTPAGVESVIYSFQGGSDGATPNSSLINVKGTLYGTTYGGGVQARVCRAEGGCGTVFAVTP
jgi:uncharacterized repeat protein (TIGR03803 family)